VPEARRKRAIIHAVITDIPRIHPRSASLTHGSCGPPTAPLTARPERMGCTACIHTESSVGMALPPPCVAAYPTEGRLFLDRSTVGPDPHRRSLTLRDGVPVLGSAMMGVASPEGLAHAQAWVARRDSPVHQPSWNVVRTSCCWGDRLPGT
jgi:hypothetical protein